MSGNYLITGYWGEPHVTAENDRGFNAAVFGAGKFVLPVGEMFRAEYIGNNTVRVYDGKLLDGGALAGIPAGKYLDFLIPEAGQGMNRNDLIIFEYSQDASTMIESGVFKVVSGVETSGTAVDPELHEENILSDEAMLDQMALLRVSVSGAVISDPEALFEVARNAKDITPSAYNLLDNSDFSNPVCYGTSGTASYTLERWTANKLTITQEATNIKTVPTATYAYIKQTVKVTPGKTYTCAAHFSNADVGEIRIYDTAISTQYAKAAKISMVGCASFTVPAGVNEIAVLLYPNAANANSGIVYWAALYEGEYTKDTLPKYQAKGYGVEAVNSYGGASKIELLWENASPTSAFAAQTVALDLAGFAGVFIYYKNQSTGSVYYSTGFIGKGDEFTLIYTPSVASTVAVARKGSVSETGVTFADTSNSTAYDVPVKIYGVRGTIE